MTIYYGITMNIARSVARSVARAVAASPIRGGASYDSDALDYFSRAEALGGSFDQTGINGTYTEAYVKTAISDFIAGCKTDSIWTKLTEAYLLTGVTFGGLMAKLKYDTVATLTNNNFVTGDYLTAGSGAGLTGNGTSKYLNTSFLDTSLSADNKSLGTYRTNITTAGSKYLMGAAGGGEIWALGVGSTTTRLKALFPLSTVVLDNVTTDASGFAILSRRGVNDVEAYFNGTSVAVDNSTAAASNVGFSHYIFAYNNSGTPANYTDATITFAHVGTGLTDTDAANLSTRVNALMTAIGANVY